MRLCRARLVHADRLDPNTPACSLAGLGAAVSQQRQEVVAQTLAAPLLLGVVGGEVVQGLVPVVEAVGGLVVNLLGEHWVHVGQHRVGEVHAKVLLQRGVDLW